MFWQSTRRNCSQGTLAPLEEEKWRLLTTGLFFAILAKFANRGSIYTPNGKATLAIHGTADYLAVELFFPNQFIHVYILAQIFQKKWILLNHKTKTSFRGLLKEWDLYVKWYPHCKYVTGSPLQSNGDHFPLKGAFSEVGKVFRRSLSRSNPTQKINACQYLTAIQLPSLQIHQEVFSCGRAEQTILLTKPPIPDLKLVFSIRTAEQPNRAMRSSLFPLPSRLLSPVQS